MRIEDAAALHKPLSNGWQLFTHQKDAVSAPWWLCGELVVGQVKAIIAKRKVILAYDMVLTA